MFAAVHESCQGPKPKLTHVRSHVCGNSRGRALESLTKIVSSSGRGVPVNCAVEIPTGSGVG